MANDDDGIGGLVALGFIILIGAGIYAILRSFGNHERGDKVTEEELITTIEDSGTVTNQETEESDNICQRCGTINPSYCCVCGICLACVGNSGCYCTACDD